MQIPPLFGSELANVTDKNGKPIFIPDPSESGVFRVLGMMVKQDDSMEDGEVLMSSPYVGYQANVNKDLTVMTEDHVKARNTDYCGYAIAGWWCYFHKGTCSVEIYRDRSHK